MFFRFRFCVHNKFFRFEILGQLDAQKLESGPELPDDSEDRMAPSMSTPPRFSTGVSPGMRGPSAGRTDSPGMPSPARGSPGGANLANS